MAPRTGIRSSSDERLSKVLEPNAPTPQERFQLAKWCIENGITTTGIVAPYLPFGHEYARRVFDAYKTVGIQHLSIQLLKLSQQSLNRLCELLPEHAEQLASWYADDERKHVEWRVPGGLKVQRSYVNTDFMRDTFARLKEYTAEYEMTISTCTEVAMIINDHSFNREALKSGFTCVGFSRTR